MKFLPSVLCCAGLLAGMAAAALAHDDVRHYAVGELDIVALRDANTTMEKKLLPELNKFPEFEGVFTNGPAPAVEQTFYFRNGNKKVLVDAGWGQELKIKGNTLSLLQEMGVSPEDITDILITHMDYDHIGGLLSNGKPVYPNATLWLAKPEYDAGIGKTITQRPEHALNLAQQVVTAYKGKVRQFEHGDEIMPGVKSVGASGHTPGHTAYDITSGKGKMTIAGDVLHIAAVQLRNPELSTVYDIDPDKAAATRQQLLERAVTEKSLFSGMHFPMISSVRKLTDGGFAMQEPR